MGNESISCVVLVAMMMVVDGKAVKRVNNRNVYESLRIEKDFLKRTRRSVT